MDKIGLIDIDSKLPNLALMKLSAYYKKKGCMTELTYPLFSQNYDRVFASQIYTWTESPSFFGEVELGGSGVSLEKELPIKIEQMRPDYDLYPDMDYSMGFTTRGCSRKCPFCIVPKKEGKIRAVATIQDIWDRRHEKIILFDNNILALSKHFFKIISELKKDNLWVDFNQGLDHRLLDNDICRALKSIRHREFRFAFDNISYEKSVLKAIEMLKKAGLKRNFWYVLVGFDSTIDEDLYRLNLLRQHKQNAYVQRYNFNPAPEYIAMAEWANQHHIFYHYTWKQFLNHPKKRGYKKYFE